MTSRSNWRAMAATSDTISVRDHSRPCEHGSLWPHAIDPTKAKWWQEPECLGGREMMLRSLGDGVWTEVDDEGDSSRPLREQPSPG